MGSTILEIKQPKFYNTIVKTIQETKKIQHAYLIETNGVEEKEALVLEFVKEIFKLKMKDELLTQEQLQTYIDNDSFPDLKIVKPKDNMIRKEDLLKVKNAFLEKSVYEGYQIYIIYDAEKLNVSAANTILKFLEEPEDNIIAVLTTDYRYQMLETILSRCQILSFQKNETEIFISDELKLLLDLMINRKQEDLFLSYSKIQEQILIDKANSIIILKELNRFFSILLKCKYQLSLQKKEDLVAKYSKDFSQEEIIKILEIINQKYQELQFNVNFKAWIDSFLLLLMEV